MKKKERKKKGNIALTNVLEKGGKNYKFNFWLVDGICIWFEGLLRAIQNDTS